MFGKQLDKSFNKPQFLGGLIGGIGSAVVGGIFGSKNQKSAQKHASGETDKWIAYQKEIGTEHEQLDKISGGAYGDYMSKYAFASPEAQGQMARDMQSAMYPELNAWELAGSSSSGVAGAMGENANSNVQAAQAREHDTQMTQMKLKADLAKTQMQTEAQQSVAMINAGASVGNNIMNNETQREAIQTTERTAYSQMDTNMQITEMQLKQAQKQLDLNTRKVEGELQQMASNMKVNEANTKLLTEKAITEYMTQSGIQLSNEAKDIANKIAYESMEQQIQHKQTGQSYIGKTVTDVVNAAELAIEEVLQISTGENSTFNKMREGVMSFFGSDSQSPKTHSVQPLQGN